MWHVRMDPERVEADQVIEFETVCMSEVKVND